MSQKKETIEISGTLFASLKQSVDDSGFESVEEFVDFVLEEVIRRGTGKERELTDDEQKEIDKSLKELGYLPEKAS
jgi:hypothetical protein